MCAFKEEGYLMKSYFFVELLVISRVLTFFYSYLNTGSILNCYLLLNLKR